VDQALSTIIKHGLQSIGHYRRTLAHASLPGVAVLCYHGVRDDSLPPASMPFEYLHMPASTFDAHCRLIRECCDPVSLDDWRASLSGGPALPHRPVLMTFDDGYRSVLTKAAPILQKYSLPAAVFVCTGPMGSRTRLWFDDVAERESEEAVEQWKGRGYDVWSAACATTAAVDDGDPRALMSAAELKALASIPGIEIGGHTVNHPILAKAPAAVQREEITQNLRTIEQWTGVRPRAFAYPNGRPELDYNADSIAILRDNGIDMAFTTRPSFARAGEGPLERSRFFLLDDTSDAELAHRLTYSWPR
jgi:peptidoglycan/xylan/chitin deacetylase (PgdA/CDA1 family)